MEAMGGRVWLEPNGYGGQPVRAVAAGGRGGGCRGADARARGWVTSALTEPGGSLRILVVDDEPAMVGAVSALVGSAGHQVVTAYDGDTALRRLAEEQPDLILLDLAMPGRDGVDVCREVRRTSDVPIIVLTGESRRAGQGGGTRRGRRRLRHEAVRPPGAAGADPRRACGAARGGPARMGGRRRATGRAA